MTPTIRSGIGFDVHRLVAGEELWLCGVKHARMTKVLPGHSDADVAMHALTDAVLGCDGAWRYWRSFSAFRCAVAWRFVGSFSGACHADLRVRQGYAASPMPT